MGRKGACDFEVSRAKDFPGEDYHFVALFDCLHAMGDPVGASAHVLQSLKPDDAWMIVEARPQDTLHRDRLLNTVLVKRSKRASVSPKGDEP
ncbi:hypothetical protein [Accumulibacter sp.]|uniref:hypothetical protein n=1 Tax=Accumulibacter sp. TaxID=2053492 RepID=UPI00391BFE6E